MTTHVQPPGSRQRYPGESLLAFKRGPLAFLSELHQTHGDIAHFTVARENFYLIGKPPNAHSAKAC